MGVRVSATNRGGERSPLDFYETPQEATHAFMHLGPFEMYQDAILDAGCGTGAIASCVKQYCEQQQYVIGCDIEFRPEFFDRCPYVPFFQGDFLKMDRGNFGDHRIGAVIMNPPYLLAQEFIEHALTLTDGPVAALLRLNFLGGGERSKWLSVHVPDVYVLADRPSFGRSVSCSRKKECDYRQMFPRGAEYPRTCPTCGASTKSTTSDATEYAWMEWRRNERGEGKVRILR